MSRGYLWENLSEEVVNEFSHIQQNWISVDVLPLNDAKQRAQAIERSRKCREKNRPAVSETENRRRIAIDFIRMCLNQGKKQAVICRELNEREIKSPRGGVWYGSSLHDFIKINVNKEPMREKLPSDRTGVTHHFIVTHRVDNDVCEFDAYLTVGLYKDGRVGEIFIKSGKDSNEHAMLDQWAVAVSVALQNGADFESLMRKFIGTCFEPSGITNNKEIPRCSSVADYVARYLLAKYVVIKGDK